MTTAKQTKPTKAQQLDLDNIKIDTLAEIQGKKEALNALVKANPYIEIKDNATYEQAKKNRTTLRTGRTDTEKEAKAILDKIKTNLTDPVKKIYSEFVELVKPAEDKQQEEIKRYEDVKEQEKQEKARLEEERKQNHINNINKFYDAEKAKVDNLDYAASLEYEVKAVYEGLPVPEGFFEEYQTMFEAKVETLKMHLIDRKRTLQQQEDIRLENDRLAAERAEIERQVNIKGEIQHWFNQWENNIENFMEFEDIQKVTDTFLNEKPIDVAEFAELYAERRAILVKKLETRTDLLNKQEEQRLKDEEFLNQQIELERERRTILTDKRKLELQHLGFDKELTYSKNELHIMFPIEDILCDKEEWEEFIKDTELKIAESKLPKDAPTDFEVKEPEIVNAVELHELAIQEKHIVSEVETFNPDRKVVEKKLINFIKNADYKILLEMLVQHGLATAIED